MFLRFLQKIISFRVDEMMEQAVVNRVRRINIYYLILITMLCFSILYSYLADVSSMSLINGIVLALAVATFLFLPVGRRSNLSSMLVLVLTALIILNAYLFNMGVASVLILAFYLIFPLLAVSMNGRHGIYVPILLGIATLILNSLPLPETAIHLDLYNALLFFTSYALIVAVSIYMERTNRELLTRLKDSKSQVEHKMVEKDEFISNLSHKQYCTD
jgi:hypothetical protein